MYVAFLQHFVGKEEASWEGTPMTAATASADLSTSKAFSLRPSGHTTLSKCSLQSLSGTQQSGVFSCFTKCLHNPCCQAVNISSCGQSYVKTEELDFVKEVIKYIKSDKILLKFIVDIHFYLIEHFNFYCISQITSKM